MSNALSIAAVTAVLKDLLDNALVDHSVSTAVGGAVEVTAVAPDLIPLSGEQAPRLNLYLYRVTPNAGWRNAGLPSRGGDGARLSNPPLALDLHYLLTAYGTDDFEAEILLGYAMQLLHEVPVLTREIVRTTLAAPSPIGPALLPPALSSLTAADLAEQVELVKITPEPMSAEEISKLWAAFGASYRPSAAYQASVVLIEADRPVRTPLPVLTRGPRDPDTGAEEGVVVVPGLVPPYPTLTEIRPPAGQPSARLGETVRLLGHHLGGTGHRVVLAHARLDEPLEVTPAPADVVPDEIAVALEIDPTTDAATWPAGLWAVHVAVTQEGTERTTNEWPLALAPRIDAVAAATADGATTFSVDVTPEVRPGQRAALVVGQREAPADPASWPTDGDGTPQPTASLTFVMEGVAAGTYPVRLRVDGVESHLVDRTQSPPAFDPSQQVTVP